MFAITPKGEDRIIVRIGVITGPLTDYHRIEHSVIHTLNYWLTATS
ncbi:MAG: hypothetical protein K2O88_00220 [Paramuribaculum sp.]|nr:hypothetical protein [Paramuribaculum sp.]